MTDQTSSATPLHTIQLGGYDGKPMLLDCSPCSTEPSPLIIFSHGFKSFKDFGYFNLLPQLFNQVGFHFVKFNFSHNGTSVEAPQEFVDKDAFAQNNLSKEVADLQTVVDWAIAEHSLPIAHNKIYLVGHSRGAAISVIHANKDARIQKVASWAGPYTFDTFFNPKILTYWEKRRTIFYDDRWTGQKLPIHFQIMEDYRKNKNVLNPANAFQQLAIPVLQVHGTEDPTVPYEQAEQINQQQNVELLTLQGADHHFGGIHPWNDVSLPKDAALVVEQTIQFFKK